MTERYEPKEIEQRWQRVWEDARAFHTPNPEPGEVDGAKTYVVEMLPYPSGELHMGHVLNYTIGDVVVHLRRRRGYRVLRPMGYDAFGLPAENAAIRDGVHPRISTERNIVAIRGADAPHGLGDGLGRARSRRTIPTTTAGRNGSSSASTSAASPIARRDWSTGARSTRRCSRTSR